jgi:hypothetical protein
MPQLLYACSVLDMPQKYIDIYQKMVTAFIWDNKPPKVKYKTMINTIEEGGINLLDINCTIEAIQLKWIQKYSRYQV